MRRTIKNNFRLFLLLLLPVLILNFGCSEDVTGKKANPIELEEKVRESEDYEDSSLSLGTDNDLLENLDSGVVIDSDFTEIYRW